MPTDTIILSPIPTKHRSYILYWGFQGAYFFDYGMLKTDMPAARISSMLWSDIGSRLMSFSKQTILNLIPRAQAYALAGQWAYVPLRP